MKQSTDLIRTCLMTLLVLTQAIISIILLVSIISTSIISELFIGLITCFLLSLLIINIVFLTIKKHTPLAGQIFCIVLALACIIGGLLALRYTNSFNSFLSKVTEQRSEYKSYSVAVLDSSVIQDISGLSGKSAGFLKTDTEAETAARSLQNTVQFEANYYNDINSMFEVLQNNFTDAIVLESSRLELLQETNNTVAQTDASIINLAKALRIIYTYNVELGKNTSTSNKEITTEPFIVYIAGSDSRQGIKATAGSDVNILAVVNPITSKILLVSIPRDTYVQLHNTIGLKDKLTHAGMYGINMSKTTIEDLLNIQIDYTIRLSFNAVVEIVNQLDGIEIYSDTAMTLATEINGNKTCYYTVGTQTVDGDCALRFARERKKYSTGDLHRGENQQQIITSIINKLTHSREYLLKVPEILEAAADHLETSLTRNDITKFIRMQIADSNNWQTESIMVEGEATYEPTYSLGDNLPLYVMIPNPESLSMVTAKINDYLQY